MNDLIERYIGAVSSYFIGFKRERVYNDLKDRLLSMNDQDDELEDLLVKYGHPRSVALTYGYRPYVPHVFDKDIIIKIERFVFSISFIYLFFSTLYYLHQFQCLPFQTNEQLVSTLNTSTLVLWLLSHPMLMMLGISIIAFIALCLYEYKNKTPQDYNLEWNKEKLRALPHPSQYPSHTFESFFIIVFVLYFFCYSMFFRSDVIVDAQNNTFQMIHMMTYFFQPFIMIIVLDYVIDMTKKIYTRRYLKYSTFINSFTLGALSIFVINSSYLKQYLLPIENNNSYLFINTFIIGALVMIFIISFYKLVRNIRSYRSLFRK